MEKEKITVFCHGLLVENPDDPGAAFCKNVNLCKDAAGYTVQEIVDGTGLPVNVVKSVLYYENKDYKLATAVRMAKFFGLSVDELIGADCLRSETKKALQELRIMPDANREFFYWLVRFVHSNSNSEKSKQKFVPVLCPDFVEGCLNYSVKRFMENFEVSDFSDTIRPKLFMGLKIPAGCRVFLPEFAPGEILLLAHDRQPVNGETVVLTTEGHIWFAKYVVHQEVIDSGYYSVFGHHKIPDEELEMVIGYIVKVVAT